MRLLILFLLITSSVFSQMNDVSELTFENLENDSSELYIDFSDSLYIVKLDKYYTCGNIIDIIIYIKKNGESISYNTFGYLYENKLILDRSVSESFNFNNNIKHSDIIFIRLMNNDCLLGQYTFINI